eukprot:1287850-Rhodomonas_salina.2
MRPAAPSNPTATPQEKSAPTPKTGAEPAKTESLAGNRCLAAENGSKPDGCARKQKQRTAGKSGGRPAAANRSTLALVAA